MTDVKPPGDLRAVIIAINQVVFSSLRCSYIICEHVGVFALWNRGHKINSCCWSY